MSESSFSFSEKLNPKPGKAKKPILVTVFILIPVSLILLIFIVSSLPRRKSQDGDLKVCESDDCVAVASRIAKLMKPSADPCDDFYEFACGLMLEKSPDEGGSMLDDVMVDRLLRLIFMEGASMAPQYANLPKTLTQKCIYALSQGVLFITNDYIDILRKFDFPILRGDDDVDNQTDWTSLTKEIRASGFPSDQLVYVTAWISKTVNLAVTNPRISLYFRISFYEAFFDKYAKNPGNLSSDMTDISKFDEELYELISADNDIVKSFQDYKILELQEHAPYINWLDFLNGFLPEGRNFSKDHVLFSERMDYLEKLGSLLARTPHKTIANFIACRLVDFLYEIFDYNTLKNLHNFNDIQKTEECIRLTMRDAQQLLISKYIDAYPMDKKLRAVQDMTKKLVETYETLLKSASWLEESTRKEALSKLHSVQFNIGYEKELLDANVLDALYGNINYTGQPYIDLKLQIQLQRYNFEMNSIFEPISTRALFFLETGDPFVWNAFYINCFQLLFATITMGLLEEGNIPFFVDAPKYIQYATVGNSLAHELTHAFDSNNIMINSNGDLNSWWGNDSLLKYFEKAKCFIEKFDHIVDKSTGVGQSGELTLPENIADHGGLLISYETYQRLTRKGKTEQLLPGLQNYTQNQLFWISAAQTYCKGVTNDFIDMYNGSRDPHAWPANRVNGGFSNMQAFAEDFKCPTPKTSLLKKCSLWEFS